MFIEKCEEWLGRYGGRAFLTPSCTAALELATEAIVAPGDEVIVPSFGFSSDANCVIRAGGVPVFVDVRIEDLNINWFWVSKAIGKRTKAVIPVHYAGVSSGSPVDGVRIIEDAAQSIGNLKMYGDFACISFHETKNISCGQGGCLLVRDEEMVEKIQILRHCGTTKALVKHAWDWVEVGTQQLMSEILAEYLWEELKKVEEVTKRRKGIWAVYREKIRAETKASEAGNGHIFWFLAENRDLVQKKCGERGIRLASHYTPLHSRIPGRKHGKMVGTCEVSTRVANEILRPPMNVTAEEAVRIANEINEVLYENEPAESRWRGTRETDHERLRVR